MSPPSIPTDVTEDNGTEKLFFDESYIFLPPVTDNVCPLTYENNGLTTAKIALAASVAVPGLPSGISLNAASPSSRAAFCACGIPKATFSPSGVVTNAPSSLAAVSLVKMNPNATVLARTPKAGPHSFAIVLVRPVTPALARA